MASPTQVIIHIVGLAMFIPQPGIDLPAETARVKKAVVQQKAASAPHITVVFPKVEHYGEGMEKGWASHVETHTAMIVFHGQYSVEGWTVEDLPPTTEGLKWKYVRLSGETLSLQPSVSTPLTSTTLALPHVADMVPPSSTLAAGYERPYPSAAAVLDIRDGVVTPCTQDIEGKVKDRVDTKIHLLTDGWLTISGGTGKSLKLYTTSSKPIYIANVPLRYVTQTNLDQAYDTNHYEVYCAMMSGTVSQCKEPTLPSADRPSGCGDSTMRMTGSQPNGGDGGPQLPPVMLTSFECSNTQWP